MQKIREALTVCLLWLWVSPWTTVGLLIGAGSCVTGGRCQRRGHTLEFHGGLADWLLRLTPVGAIAITVGHVILGRTSAALDIARTHELVHVKQYERWGPLFVPIYFLLSAVVWFQGKDAYRDNPFEQAAYACDTPPHRRPLS
ncbi:hypothetical protein GYB59_04040 [bacterium]|uniref:Signal peptide prediction n=1 Tax=Rubinisphaera brasiliensis (strain ATCC 49424 / DSM 5305 / JCM 21570 / IAM 15109 / NBRC 103401 / IFAM 1448) TaxID=756272 RepID=F0SQZ2_RUBBR|nr:hypothetical protein [Rubinisphaera brasiliensis]ADY60213.1 hypothetical protein Plabr_2613 [Rubinisphaera brasiliensis DSM 5305]MBB01574.1 hypothetical protein [Planctomyces sp.]MBR9800903.1 hypothetical protein [bacterium]